MGAVAVYNGFGGYEKNGVTGELGVTLHYGGVPFFLPYRIVTYIPDYTFREIDHDKSTAPAGEEAVLTYRTERVSGEQVAAALLTSQIPYPNTEKGIVPLDGADPTERELHVHSGFDEWGTKLFSAVQEMRPSQELVDAAETTARAHKEAVINAYFQSKRERMAGGQGALRPSGMIAVFMKELGVADIDDIAKHTTGTPDTMAALLKALTALTVQNQAAVSPPPASNAPPAVKSPQPLAKRPEPSGALV